MIEYKIERVDVNTASIHPELVFQLVLTFKNGEEIPISIQGNLLAEDRMETSTLRQFDEQPIRDLKLVALSKNSKKSDYSIPTTLRAKLDAAALQHIEHLRSKNVKKDVILNLDLRNISIAQRATLHDIRDQYVKPNSIELLSLEVNPNGDICLIKQSDWVLTSSQKTGQF